MTTNLIWFDEIAYTLITWENVKRFTRRRVPLRLDAVEKVGRGRRVRNDRIEEVCDSNQGCAVDWLVESKLRCGNLKIFFQPYRS
jgi:hypothetical protein